MKTLSLTPQERTIIEEAFAPYIQAVTIVARLRGLNPATAQLSGDRSTFIVREESDQVPELNGIKQLE
jgi:hypothetical protein